MVSPGVGREGWERGGEVGGGGRGDRKGGGEESGGACGWRGQVRVKGEIFGQVYKTFVLFVRERERERGGPRFNSVKTKVAGQLPSVRSRNSE